MYANELLKELGLPDKIGTDFELRGVQLDSRKIAKNDLFLAIRGTALDGSVFIEDAIKNGAGLVFTDSTKVFPNNSVIYIENLNFKLSMILNTFFNYPLSHLECIGITGTNGKTTTAKLTTAILNSDKHQVISIGTIENKVGDEVFSSSLTTPDLVETMKLLSYGVQKGCDRLVMEVSSHGLSQGRTNGILFSRAVFTNLTQDHLDYHLNLENYFQEKKKLFTEYLHPEGLAIINYDSEYGIRIADDMVNNVAGESRKKIWFFSRDVYAGFKEQGLRLVSKTCTLHGSEIRVLMDGKTYDFKSKLVGGLHIENLLAAITLGFSLNIPYENLVKAISDVEVTGRNQVIKLSTDVNLNMSAVVDYAHTPDALQRTLDSLRPLTKGRLICVFGCGGNRDRGKRELMGKIAEESSDHVFVTSDNPRNENPDLIINDIMKLITSSEKVSVIPDRAKAIREALNFARHEDCVVIAGKGHEDYQIIGDKVTHFSDSEEVYKWISSNVKENAYHGN